ncbi:hypothetical protein ACPPVO_38000 [Dactylosporangium sp. McL0621]|uniref:hypothetical protein n=1 Tax=Dactylosporangium sp. McL0621 TaxID=3415678 RepID=UPI003CEE786D
MTTAQVADGARRVADRVRWRVPPLGVDVGLALAVTGVTVWGCHSESNPSAEAARILGGQVVTPAPTWAYSLVVAAGLALVWRRRRPRVVLGVSLAGVLAFAAWGISATRLW